MWFEANVSRQGPHYFYIIGGKVLWRQARRYTHTELRREAAQQLSSSALRRISDWSATHISGIAWGSP